MPATPIQSDLDVGEVSDVTLAILAGGEGSRMGHAKGLLEIGGVPILEWILNSLNWTGPTLLVTAPGRERPPGWKLFGSEVTDPVAGQGPLRGILTALEAAKTDLTIVMPVDMPLMGREQLGWLAKQSCDRGVLFRRRRQGPEQLEPMPLLASKSAQETLIACLRDARSSVRGLAGEAGFSVVDAPDRWEDQIWTNLNSPGDLKRFQAMENVK
jgi:molybdopterin-guanine dinucleotide biosynthesis protein A